MSWDLNPVVSIPTVVLITPRSFCPMHEVGGLGCLCVCVGGWVGGCLGVCEWGLLSQKAEGGGWWMWSTMESQGYRPGTRIWRDQESGNVPDLESRGGSWQESGVFRGSVDPETIAIWRRVDEYVQEQGSPGKGASRGMYMDWEEGRPFSVKYGTLPKD